MHPPFFKIVTQCIIFLTSFFSNFVEKDWCANSLEHVKSKSYQRRFIFEGWNNYTEFEKKMIEELRKKMQETYGMDMYGRKEFGPRTPDSYVIPGTSDIVPGLDFHFSDQLLLRYLTARNFDVVQASELLLY